MANYIAHCRTNYFEVKDAKAFQDALASVPDIEVLHEARKGENIFCLIGINADGAGWPQWAYNDEVGEDYEIDLPGIVAEHLVDNEVAIFQEVGHEKLSYLVGYAEAVNNQGEVRRISLDDIGRLASELTDGSRTISSASY